MTSRVAMVTGGNRGIGHGITEALLSDGWAVSILATRPEDPKLMAELAKLGEVHYTQGSVDNLDDHKHFLDNSLKISGKIDGLVNNAGVAPQERLDILHATPESYDRVMNINLRGPYFLTQLVANSMIETRGEFDPRTDTPFATIINVSSMSATVVSIDRGEYCISKAGQAMTTQLWAARLAPEGILVYEIRPGVIDTDMTGPAHAKYDKLLSEGLSPIPRWGYPSDAGSTVRALMSLSMPMSTGDVINVDGGMHISRL